MGHNIWVSGQTPLRIFLLVSPHPKLFRLAKLKLRQMRCMSVSIIHMMRIFLVFPMQDLRAFWAQDCKYDSGTNTSMLLCFIMQPLLIYILSKLALFANCLPRQPTFHFDGVPVFNFWVHSGLKLLFFLDS